MSISGLSKQLRFVVTIVTTLLVGFSLFRSACAATDSHEFTDSRQFKKNLEVSRYRNNTYWLPNYTWKPLEKSDAPRKKPIWETKQQVVSEEEKKKRLLFDEWDKKMRQITKSRIREWKTRSEEENLTSNANSVSSNKDLKRPRNNIEPEMSTYDQGRGDSIKVQKSLRNGYRGMAARNSSADPMNANPVRSNTKKSVNKSIFPKGRWGMSIKEAPKKFLKEISKSDIREPRPSARRQQPESLKKRLANEVRTTSRASVAVTFPPGRWGIDVKEPPPEFLNEIKQKLFAIKIGSKAEAGKKNAGDAEDRKLFGAQGNRGGRKNIETGWTSMERTTELSNGRWSPDKGSLSRNFLREIPTRGRPASAAFYKPTMSYEPIVGLIPIHDPRSQQSALFRNSIVWWKQSVSFTDPIVPSIHCVVCQR